MDLRRTNSLSPSETGINAGVFRINDIDLTIPPSQIEVRKEDLTYRYRTLRSKVATKIPTGHGQCSMHLSIYFTEDQLLTLHRLVIELKNSPFFYVSNRYLRETIGPDWPFSQSMVFSLTGLTVSNLPNSSDTLVLQLDAHWFNYFPYMHNWMYREEWQTNYLKTTDAAPGARLSKTIGWSLKPDYTKVFYDNILQSVKPSEEVEGESAFQRASRNLNSFSLETNSFKRPLNQRTIYEMESASAGVDFDLLPLPSNMMPARIVSDPLNSRIYVRYINYLQRDALLKNFDINVEDDIVEWQIANKNTTIYPGLFNVVATDGADKVFPLNDSFVPRQLRHKWITQMAVSKYSFNLYYNIYKELRLPQRWVEKAENNRNQVITELFGQIATSEGIPNNLTPADLTNDISSILFLGGGVPISSKFGLRKLKEEPKARDHEGVDFAVPVGTAVYAPESGRVSRLSYDKGGSQGNLLEFVSDTGNVWKFMHLSAFVGQVDVPIGPGRVIARTGDTGRSSGPHLHVEFFYPGASQPSDPVPVLELLLSERIVSVPEQSEDQFSLVPEPFFEYEESEEAYNGVTEEKNEIVEAAARRAKEQLDLTQEETEALAELFLLLKDQGWFYYDEDPKVLNVWKRIFSLNFSISGQNRVLGSQDIAAELKLKGTVLTSITGSLSHVVASIPILGQEFPTQQHLGSIEPEYQFEFAILDDQSTYDGVGVAGQHLQSMRSQLQSNSRNFRPITDGWCFSCDTFITRLLGTYEANDVEQEISNVGTTPEIADVSIKKRCVISSSYSGTVPGNPGLSTLVLGATETNPYLPETLNSTSSSLKDKEKSRELVIDAIWRFKFKEKYKNLIESFPTPETLSLEEFAESLGFGSKGIYSIPSPEESGFGDNSKILNGSTGSDLELISAFSATQTDRSSINLSDEVLADLSTQGVIQKYNTYVQSRTANTDYAKLEDTIVRFLTNVPLDGTTEKFQEILDIYKYLATIVSTGERLLAEVELGGLGTELIAKELYTLPAVPYMWQSWQMYLQEFCKRQPEISAESAVKQLTENPNYPFPGGKGLGWSNVLDESRRYEFARTAEKPYGLVTLYLDVSDNFIESAFDSLAASVSTDINIANHWRSKQEAAIEKLVLRYINDLPITYQLTDVMKSKYRYYLGELLGDAFYQRNKTPALESVHRVLTVNATSCGNITYDFLDWTSNGPIWQEVGDRFQVNYTRGGSQAVLFSAQDLASFGTLGSLYTQTIESGANFLIDFEKQYGNYEGSSFNLDNVYNTLAPIQYINKGIGLPFEYQTAESTEQEKLLYLKRIVSAVADDVLGDYELLEILGLEDLFFQDEGRTYNGKDCYPDLELPQHPYYGSTSLTSPDFYLWNIYEDAGALNAEMVDVIQKKVDFVIQNSYDSMKRMEKGDKYSPVGDNLTPETGLALDELNMVTQISAEGTDGRRVPEDQGGTYGPMASPFYPTKETQKHIEDWKSKSNEILAGGVIGDVGPVQSLDPRLWSTKPSEYMDGIRISTTEGIFGSGGGIQYPRRGTNNDYENLKREFESVESMFGSAEGYANQRDVGDTTIKDAVNGTSFEPLPEAGHYFDADSIKKLARDSAKDLVSQKMSLKRAFPTFKLYFVEEDEFETRLINFDDFYSYNAVKSINFVDSKRLSATHAVITLQNIAGTLDGTRRSTVVDLDYFNRLADQKYESDPDINDDAQRLTGDPITKDTSSEQPFGAVVLRPGLNVQLRVGFSNDPDSLSVLLSGRVVDVTWNKTGDLAEIMIQSFGTELEQVPKGLSRGESARTFYTTHELLGSLMLEPEVVHYGRWEFGQLFQINESRDHRFEMYDYSREGWIGEFPVTSALTNWMTKNPLIVAAGGIGLTAISFLPLGKLTKLPLVGTLFKSALPIYTASNTRTLLKGLDTAEEALELAQRTKATTQLFSRLTDLSAAATGALGKSADFAAVTAAKVGALTADINKAIAANNVDEVVALVGKIENYYSLALLKSKWMARPWMEITNVGSFFTATGAKPVWRLIDIGVNGPFKAVASVFGIATAIDTVLVVARLAYKATLKSTVDFFRQQAVALALTPQDDNLFPPHPKDYMTLNRSLFTKGVEFATHVASSIGLGGPNTAKDIYRFFKTNLYIDKLVSPDSCKYQLVNTTIWKTLYEMTLRHPGWVYGSRPYGNTFRYTLFFGLPSQRYWSKPASNAFINRANKLREFLNKADNEVDAINAAEFKTLYGDKTYDALVAPVDEYATQLVIAGLTPARIQELINLDSLVAQRMTAITLQEYLRALEIRFQPFRRYHLLTSDKDLVWNGIMGSEQAMANAVDVTYFSQEDVKADDLSEAIQSTVFKAHSFIPDYKLRVQPMRWANCKGYSMAQRYAMGELIHRVKDMYRGEIITLGNPRIRPYDICVLIDSYNDMVGPIEVDQVVHTFSHETGFITEIKPSAVVIGNDISGWPLIEGMKLFSMAVNDIYKRYGGTSGVDVAGGDVGNVIQTAAAAAEGVSSAGALAINAFEDSFSKSKQSRSTLEVPVASTAATIGVGLAGWYTGAKSKDQELFESHAEKRYKKLFPNKADISDMFGQEPPPNLDPIDGMINGTLQNATGIAVGASIVGLATSMGGVLSSFKDYQLFTVNNSGLTVWAPQAPKLKFGAAGIFTTLAGGTIAVGGAAAAYGISQIDFPGAAFLIGGSVLFLQCLRNDSIMVLPLLKSGSPIVSGLSFNDPQMLWKTFRGILNREAETVIGGFDDITSLYSTYRDELWERIDNDALFSSNGGTARGIDRTGN